MVIGLSYILIYINLLTFGYNIKEYIEFLMSQWECFLFIGGLLLEIYLFTRKDKRK